MAVLSFNGNKIITTSGGGALVTDDVSVAEHARFLATQARDPAPHYEHSELGFNYRMSNLLAALGRSQLSDLARRVELGGGSTTASTGKLLGDLPGVSFMPEAEGAAPRSG
jgi:pyridoxal phosphate-dependent aminotransferase EpsN